MKSESKPLEMIDEILKSKYFDGLSQLAKDIRSQLIYYCILNNSYEYLLIMLRYSSKNKEAILDGINYEMKDETGTDMTPLSKLVGLNHCNDDWIALMLRGFGSIKFFECKISKGLNEAIATCKEKEHAKWAELIDQYSKGQLK